MVIKKCKNSTCDSMSCSHASPYGTFFFRKKIIYMKPIGAFMFFSVTSELFISREFVFEYLERILRIGYILIC